MRIHSFLALLLLSIMFLLIGCQEETQPNSEKEGTTVQHNEAADKELLYENEEFGITIEKNSDWKLQSAEENDNLNIILSKKKLTAIVSTVSASKTFNEIKAELKIGAGDIEVISEDDTSLSFQSKLKNAIRTDIYFIEHNETKNYMVIFMAPVFEYDQAKSEMDSLLNHIKLK